MSAHTPGPWELVKFPERFVLRTQRVNPRDETEIGLIERGQENSPSFDRAIAEANARLIAAAPDLLAALKVALGQAWLRCEPDWDAARAAIAKAEGKP